jgi:uncharacterized glyoxalase superfamily protein PhnB
VQGLEVIERVPDDPLILPQLKYVHPIEAIAWLCRVFRFTEESRMVGADGALLIAALRSPLGGRIMIGSRKPANGEVTFPPAVAAFHAPYAITVMVDDVDEHYAHAVAEGAQVFQPVRDQPWGWRDYEPVDLEGRFWNFSQILSANEA